MRQALVSTLSASILVIFCTVSNHKFAAKKSFESDFASIGRCALMDEVNDRSFLLHSVDLQNSNTQCNSKPRLAKESELE